MKLLLAGFVLCFGCQTQFTGSPHISPAACQQRCVADQLVMAGMVYMGEYSSACLCEIPRAPAAAPGAAAGGAAAAVGVVMQMRRQSAASAQR